MTAGLENVRRQQEKNRFNLKLLLPIQPFWYNIWKSQLFGFPSRIFKFMLFHFTCSFNNFWYYLFPRKCHPMWMCLTNVKFLNNRNVYRRTYFWQKLVTQFYNQFRWNLTMLIKIYSIFSLPTRETKTDGSNHLQPIPINKFNCENNKKRKFFLKHLQAHKPKKDINIKPPPVLTI